MIDKIMRLLGKEKLSNIKILEKFKEHPPKQDKMMIKRTFYIINDKFEQSIILNKDNYLVDGYTTYLLAKELDKKYMSVKRI